MSTRIARREFAKLAIDRSIRSAFASSVAGKPRRRFAHLLWNVQSRSELLRPACHVGRVDGPRLDEILTGLLAMSIDRYWLRPVEAWEPTGVAPGDLFSSLAHHLFALYPVPPALLSAWTRGTCWFARRTQNWFRHVGQGGSLRTAGMPIALSKRMAHEFTLAPARFSIEFALRWAQVRGLGGSDTLARSIAGTRLGREFDARPFWLSVVHLFLNTPRVAPEEIRSIVDYLYARKFDCRPAIIGDGVEIELDPPEPDLSIKGRTVASLLRRVAEWEAEAPTDQPQKTHVRWEPLGLNPYRREAEDGLAWTIRELLDSDELAAEGEAMKHCVATYTSHCQRRRSSIWSLAAEGPAGRDRLLTIEVHPKTRQVVQASMKGNDDPDETCLELLKDWAGREGLNVETLCTVDA